MMNAIKVFGKFFFPRENQNVLAISPKTNKNFCGYRSYSLNKGHAPNTLEKYLLVWMKKYPSVKEVPNHVTFAMMERVRNKARVRIAILLTILTGVVSVGYIYSGKQAAKRGESLHKMNLRWHAEQENKK